MSATQPRRGDATEKLATVAVWTALVLIVLTIAVTNLAARIAGAAPRGGNPITVTLGVLHVPGSTPVPWTLGCTLVAAGIGLLLAVPLLAVAVWRGRRRVKRSRVDVAARHMASGRELDRFTMAAARGIAQRLGCRTDIPGVFVGYTIGGRQQLWADWESSEVDIWGVRTGKTASRAIPVVLEAPGAVVATANKRDLIDATRDPRSEVGQVWVFDPQHIIGDQVPFTYNPLDFILSGPADPVVKAQQLAAIFAAAMAPPESKSDKFFDTKGPALCGHLLLAAAVSDKTLVDVYRWVNRERDAEPVALLEAAGYKASAEFVRGIIGQPVEQRGGIYATAESCITWMTNPAAVAWITPDPARPAFDPTGFALTRDTLYLVSREGLGTLGALTAALTAAVCEAAEHTAMRCHLGRLPVPMVVCLDEAANVCRWPELPALFSHYGGRGIYLLVILQSYRQGESTWGPRGMATMWSAASVRLYGGGNAEVGFLDELRRLIGPYRPQQVSATSSRQGRSTSYSEGSDDILDVSDLSALPRGRQVLIGSGARPTLIAARPWFTSRWKAVVEASIRAHDPAAEETLAEVAATQLNPEPDVAPAGAAWSGATA